MPLEQPVLIESFLELQQRLPQFFDGIEVAHPQQLLLQGADEALGHAVALRRPDKARAGFDAEKLQLLLDAGHDRGAG